MKMLVRRTIVFYLPNVNNGLFHLQNIFALNEFLTFGDSLFSNTILHCATQIPTTHITQVFFEKGGYNFQQIYVGKNL